MCLCTVCVGMVVYEYIEGIHASMFVCMYVCMRANTRDHTTSRKASNVRRGRGVKAVKTTTLHAVVGEVSQLHNNIQKH